MCLQLFCSLGDRYLEATPTPPQDPRAVKLEKLKRLQTAIKSLVHLRYLKKLKEQRDKAGALPYGALFHDILNSDTLCMLNL